MKRKQFLKMAGFGGLSVMSLSFFADRFRKTNSPKMPVLFVGHGSPMNVIQDNEFTRSWAKIGASLPKPKAILAVSAHWYIDKTKVTAMPNPRTIYDFYGFPKEMYELKYDAPGSPEFAKETQNLVDLTQIELDHEWGLDHGTWCVLKAMYPEADIPVFQLSINYKKRGDRHFELAKQLSALREKGVLIMGSGNIVHNLRMPFNQYYDFVPEFDNFFKEKLIERNFSPLVNYEKLGQAAKLSVPTPDHYWPAVYTMGLIGKNEEISFFNEKPVSGAISMRSFLVT